MSGIQVSIIIVNYNTRKMTQECIESVFENTKDISIEVILVDNRSTDDSKLFFEKDKRLRYVYSFENMGFGRANNVGLMLAKGEYVFLLNSDTLMTNNAIKIFYDNAKKNPNDHAFYGGWLMSRNRGIIHSYADIPTMKHLINEALLRYVHFFKRSNPLELAHQYEKAGESIEVGYVTGADLFFSRCIFEKYGAFDHHFFMYCEESDMQWRMKKYGIKSYIIKGPDIIHLCGEQNGNERKVRNVRVKLMNLESQKYMLRKHYNHVQYILFRIVYFILLFFPTLFDFRYYSLRDRVKYVCALAT